MRAHRIAALAALIVIACGGGSPPPAAPPCPAGDGATLVEARMLRGQGYLHRARARAVEASGRCDSAEVTDLIATLDRELDPGTESAEVLARQADAHRRAGRPAEARAAGARALVAAERQGPLVAVVAGDTVAAQSVAFADDGKALVVGLADGRGLRFDLADPGAAPTPATPPPAADTATRGPVQASIRGTEIALGEQILTGHDSPVTAVALDPNGLLLASAAADGVRLWDTTLAAPMAHLAFGPGGDWLITGASGRVDGSQPMEGGPDLLRWRAGELELPGHLGWQRNYHRGLLSDLVRRRVPF